MKEAVFKARLPLEDRNSWDRIHDWLHERGLSHHLVNIYFNRPSDIIVVLNDRNTAIMLKLALT